MDATVDTEQVATRETARRVRDVFDAAAWRYDAMNDVMSLGSHRLFKRMAVEMARLRPGKRVLDLAGGTGDIALLAARQVRRSAFAPPPAADGDGRVVLADINRAMLDAGRKRVARRAANVDWAQADATELPFADGAFHAVLVGFGLRNFADKEAGLREMLRVLGADGVAVVLDFSTVRHPLLARAFDAVKATWPTLGRVVAGNADPYRYLVTSIRNHPDQDTLSQMMRDAGFARVEYHNLFGGAAAIHRGFK